MNYPAQVQAASMPEDITPEMIEQIDHICDRYHDQPGSLIPVLQKSQQVAGYLPVELQEHIADRLGVPGHEVFGVASFYSFFTMKPKGRHCIRVCMGTACYVRGGREALERLERHLGIQVDQMTPDRRFSLEQVRCLGACGVAPVMVVDDDTHRTVMADKVVDIIERYP